DGMGQTTPMAQICTTSTMLLPVPPKFFPPVKLNEEDEAHMRRLAKEKLRGMQDLFQGRYPQAMQWVPCEQDLAQVMNAIASCKTDEYRKQMRGLYGANFVDGVCLHKLPTTKQNRPAYFYTALKWCVLQPPTKNGKGLGSDFCFLEYAGIHKETEVHEKVLVIPLVPLSHAHAVL
ncbi:hypothetical protein DYB32_007126, partial [Aphanomyces invadans]